MKSQRIRVIDFMQDFDRLRRGRITHNEFLRALASFPDFIQTLSDREVNSLLNRYTSALEPDKVDYLKFSEEMESVLIDKSIERDPTLHAHE